MVQICVSMRRSFKRQTTRCWQINGKNCEGVCKEWWLYAYKFMCKHAFWSMCCFLVFGYIYKFVTSAYWIHFGELQSKYPLQFHSLCICWTSFLNHSKLSCTEVKLISKVWRWRITHLRSSRSWESAHTQSCHSEHSSQTLSQGLWPFGSDWLSVCPDECTVRIWPPSG